MKNIVMIILMILIAGGAFFAGMKYQGGKQPALSGQFNGSRNRMGLGAGNRAGFRPVSGEIISADSNSITVKLQDGGSKIVILSDKTQINKAETASKNELKTGVKVAVFGTDNSDGSVTAQNIQLNPVSREMMDGKLSPTGTQ